MKKTIQQHFYSSIGLGIFSVLMGFGLKIYLATVIAKTDLALYYTAIDIFSFSLLVLIGFRSSMVVTYNKLKEDNAIVNIFRYFIFGAMLISWAFVLPYVKHHFDLSIDYWYLVATIFSMSLYLYLSNQLTMYRLYSIMNKTTFLEPIFSVIWFALAFYMFSVQGVQALFIMSIMGSFSLSLYIYFYKKNASKEPVIKRVILDKEMRTFIKKSLISTLEFSSGMLLIYLSVFFFNHYYSVDEVGDFQVVTKPILMYMITLFVFPVFRFILPELSKLYYQDEKEAIRKIKTWFYRFSFFVSFVFMACIYFFGTQIIEFLFPDQYNGAYLYLSHLTFFFLFIMLNAYQIAFIKASGAFNLALYIRLSGLAFFIAAFYITKYYSQNSISVIIGLDAAYLGMFLFSWFTERKILRGALNNQST
jgi:O-antigen/teichoic acid export membrane protein